MKSTCISWQCYDSILQWGNCILQKWSWSGEWRRCINYILPTKDLSRFQLFLMLLTIDTLILRIKLLNLYVYFFIILVIDEWNNFMERINSKRESEVWGNEENVLQLRHWASLRGQTLCRTGSLVILPYLVSITWLFGTWVIGEICLVYYVCLFFQFCLSMKCTFICFYKSAVGTSLMF